MAKAPTTETTNTPSTEIATISSQVSSAVGALFEVAGKKFKVKEQVSMPVLKQRDEEAVFVTFLTPAWQGEELKNAKAGATKMEPAMLAKVSNLLTGSANILIVNKVLQGELERAFPFTIDGKIVERNEKGELPFAIETGGKLPANVVCGYVGKSLGIRMHAAETGRRYKTFDIIEVELEGDAA